MSRRRLAVAFGFAIVAIAAAAAVWLVVRSRARTTELPARSCWSSPDCDERCAAGDGRACTHLGRRLLRRSQLVPDASRAATLLERACELGDGLGCLSLAQMFDTGDGGAIDADRASSLRARGLRALERRCEGADPWSCYDLGEAFRSGDNVAVDAERAAALGARTLDLARAQCDDGKGRSCYMLGHLHEGHMQVAVDDDVALDAYRRGCEAGDVNACARAVLDREACELGSPLSCSRVARPYLYGIGGEVDVEEGIRWEMRACEVGYAPSCVYVAHAALRGDGLPADVETAAVYAERAAALYGQECDLGDPSACDYVGDTFDEKPLGRSRSAFEARARGTALYERSCANGEGLHCQVAAFRYGNGLGALVDPARAHDLLTQACELGVVGACEALAPRPTPEDDRSLPDDPAAD